MIRLPSLLPHAMPHAVEYRRDQEVQCASLATDDQKIDWHSGIHDDAGERLEHTGVKFRTYQEDRISLTVLLPVRPDIDQVSFHGWNPVSLVRRQLEVHPLSDMNMFDIDWRNLRLDQQ